MAVDFTPDTQGSSGIDFTPDAPKPPDTSGVQVMAQSNLAANDNKEEDASAPQKPQSPQERLDTATGMPVQNILNGTAQPSDINAANRGHYINALKNGSAVDGSDWMQSMLHAVVPIAAGIPQEDIAKTIASSLGKSEIHLLTSTSGSLASDVIQNTLNLPVQGATRLAGAAYETMGGELSPNAAALLTQGIPEFGQNKDILKLREAAQAAVEHKPTTEAGKIVEGALGIAPYLIGGEASLARKGIGALATGAGSEVGRESAESMGFAGQGQKVGQILGGAPGMIYGGGKPAESQFTAGAGPWDNHPGSDIIKNAIAKKLDKEPSAVTSSDIDKVIANGSKNILPSGQDFKDVATAIGGNATESTLHIVFKETGVKPDQVFEDAQRDPTVAADISDGKVPDAYEHLIEPKSEQSEGLQVTRSETGRSFDVVDKDGDHVQGGFDSAEEANQYIEDKKLEPIGDEPPEWKDQKEPLQDAPVPAKNLAQRIIDKVLSSDKEEKIIEQKSPIPNVIRPSEIGKPTSLRTFLSNNGAKFNEAHELISIKRDGEKITGKSALEHANEIAKEHGYLSEEKNDTDLENLLEKNNGGREAFRDADADRLAQARETSEARKNLDPDKIEHEVHVAGLDTEIIKGETPKQRTSRLLKALQDFYKNQEGAGAADAYRKAIGDTITATEKFVGKLTGGLFEKLGNSYIKTFMPELIGDAARRADAYMAKFKTAKQEAENAFYRQSASAKARFDKLTSDQRMQWLYNHETGRWNEEDDPDHARYQALLDSTFKAEKESIGADSDKGYKENYLPHMWENADAVKAFFNSEAMIKKYGKNGFTKASTFKLIQDGVRAGFKLRTDNPESMLVARLLAGHDMIATMDLLRDLESSGIAKKATAFSLDKKIGKTQASIDELDAKYKTASNKINDPKQLRWDFADPAVSKYMKSIASRMDVLKERLDNFNKEKSENKLTPEEMKELKGNGFKIIGPDSKVWSIHQQIAPLWKNAMEMKGLWENQGVVGDAYRTYTGTKALWTQLKLGFSLFHPLHVAMIDFASDVATATHHLIQGGKLSDLLSIESIPNIGITKDTFKGRDAPGIVAWHTPKELRTPHQQYMVQKRLEGGFKPTMSARDTVHFKENFDKAISGIGTQNLRLLGSALQLPGVAMKPFFEHWIPGMKDEVYEQRTEHALMRDPSLKEDAGRRVEVFRQIAKDTDRTYGEMNNDVQFWNKNVRDSFNAAFISGGWKLAQIYNARGLLQPAKIAYNFAKTGEFNKEDITFNMLHAYAYTGLTLALGGALNAMMGNPIGTAKDTVWDMVKNLVAPQTGDKNPDGTPIRLNQPAFAKEAYNLAHEINTKGLIGGTGSFLYHQTLIPGIVNTLSNQDFTGRELISDPTDLHQWMNAGWDTISPISIGGVEKAEAKHSVKAEVMGLLGFPMAGAYLNQTPFEQKVLYTYDEQNPPKGDVYSLKLKSELKTAMANGNSKDIENVKEEMKKEGMTDTQISNAEKIFTTPFVDIAWKKLSAEDQKHLISHATDEEKERFKLKNP